MIFRKTTLLLLLFLLNSRLFSQVIPNAAVFANYMKGQSLTWDTINTNFYTGAVLGNGLLGTNVYKENDHALRFDIGRADLTDHRLANDPASQDKLFGKARLPIGRILLVAKGKILASTMELDIYNAMLNGMIRTDSGTISFKAFVPSNRDIIYLEANGTSREKNIKWNWISEKSISPRALMVGERFKPPIGYEANPPVELTNTPAMHCAYQRLKNSGAYATCWSEFNKAGASCLALTVSYDPVKPDKVKKQAAAEIKSFLKADLNSERSVHQAWWNTYFQKSFISLPDKRLESFYWIQLYKLASATRANKPMLDLMGPWMVNKTPWPAIWWNLNVQLTYSPIFTSNHLDLGFSLYHTLNKNLQNLIQNVPQQWQNNSAAIGRTSSYDLISPITEQDIIRGDVEAANLTWTMYYYYQHYLYSGDKKELRKFIYPLLKRSVNFIIHLLKKDEQGIYHLPLSFSPEYKAAEDANYTLAALNWGIKALVQADSVLNLQDPDMAELKRIKETLVPYPVNETGYMIGKNVSLNTSHRHYSHLMMIYPYTLIDLEKNKALIERSLNNWLLQEGALQGYSFTGSASMYALLGNGNKSYQLLNQLLNSFTQPNTFYKEAGPVIETPLSAATSILELLLQSRDGKLLVFPAIPAVWKNVSFAGLRAEGNFFVSASRNAGKTIWLQVVSNQGGTCRLITDIPAAELSASYATVSITTVKEKTFVEWKSRKGEVLELKRTNSMVIKPGPVESEFFKANYWGLKKIR